MRRILISNVEFFIADQFYHFQTILEDLEAKEIQVVRPLKENTIEKNDPRFNVEIYKLRRLSRKTVRAT